MFAVVEIGGHQFTVKVGDLVVVDRLAAEQNKTIEVNPLLVSDEAGKTSVGTPVLTSNKVSLKVVEHGKGEKVDVLRFKAKKHYWRASGFRASQTTLEVLSIA